MKGLVCTDGIYDLVDMLEEYPSYDYFVKEAFGEEREVWRRESPAGWGLYSSSSGELERERALRFLILHSKQDELLSLRQSKLFVEHLGTLLGTEDLGKRGDGKVMGGERGSYEIDYECVVGKHEELVQRIELAQATVDWVKKIEQLGGPPR